VVRLRPGSGIGTAASEEPFEAQLEARCRDQLAGYKVPRRFIVVTESLPMNTAGKVAKQLLRDRYALVGAKK
jgi:acyl-CoA synthetase (AMP-forming)/AMP-acid ligase II